MSSTLNAQLIDAVEAGGEVDIKRLIEAGASPNARKNVTLKAKVNDGRGGFKWKEDTVECESALALAVLHANVGVVRILLEKGARVDGEVQWRISNWWSRVWTAEQWQRARWLMTCSFPSVIALAIGRGGKLTRWDSGNFNLPHSNGKVALSPRGGAVAIAHPTKDDRLVMTTVQSNVEIFRILLVHSARVTDVELEAARGSPIQEFLLSLESHRRGPIVRPAPSPLELANNTHAQQIRGLKAQLLAAEERVRVAERKQAEVEQNTAALQARNAALERDNATLRHATTSLGRESTALRQEISSLRSHNTALLAENSSLRSRLPGPSQPRPPTHVNRMMFAIADYKPNGAGEIGFSAGDGIFVILANADGWGWGFHTTAHISGFFPLSHVTPDPPTSSSVPPVPSAPPPTAPLDSQPQVTQEAWTTSPF